MNNQLHLEHVSNRSLHADQSICAATGGRQPRNGPLALELPRSLKGDHGWNELSNGDAAIVTLAWVRNALVLAIFLALRRRSIAVVLDPSEPLVREALEQWESVGRMRVGASPEFGAPLGQAGPKLHLDSLVTMVMAHGGIGQSKAQFLRATASFSEVERVLCKLAGTPRMWWTQSRIVDVLSPAR